jgi:hypothetical protein
MANTYKNLGQSYPSANSLTTLYTVPGATSAVVSSIVICNLSSEKTRYSISHAIAGAADASAQYLASLHELGGYETKVWLIGPTLAATDVIRVLSENGMVSFNMYGQEIT